MGWIGGRKWVVILARALRSLLPLDSGGAAVKPTDGSTQPATDRTDHLAVFRCPDDLAEPGRARARPAGVAWGIGAPRTSAGVRGAAPSPY